MRAKTLDMSFDFYTCGFVVDSQRDWDTSYYPTVSAADSTTTNIGTNTLGIFNALTGQTGANYPRASWPLIFEAYSASLRTISFMTGGSNMNGIEPLPNFYKYPQTTVKCNIYEVLNSYQQLDSSSKPAVYWEFNINSTPEIQTVPTKLILTPTSCQKHTFSAKYIDWHLESGKTIPTWIKTDDLLDTIEIDTKISEPQSAFFTVRYMNDNAGPDYYYDIPVHVRIKPKTDWIYSDQSYSSFATCTQNIFPMSYGSDTGKHINYGIFVAEQDSSAKQILLWGKSYAMTPDDGSSINYDGYVQKITVMGTVQWMSYISSRYENDEYVAGVVQTGGAVFAYYHSNHGTTAYRTSAICKLSYLDGYLIYAKQIIY